MGIMGYIPYYAGLRTLNYGKYGYTLLMGNAGFNIINPKAMTRSSPRDHRPPRWSTAGGDFPAQRPGRQRVS